MPVFRASTNISLIQFLARALALAALLAGCGNVYAAVEPHQLVSDVIQRVMAKVDSVDPAVSQADGALLAIFEEELSPHLDFQVITQWLVGEPWAGLSAEQKGELIDAVRAHIVHVYATLLAQGRSVAIEVDPTSTILSRSAKVGARLATPDGRALDIEFRLIRSEDSWKLYDLVVAGLSFAHSLRAELAPVINAGGVEALKTYLSAH